MAFKHWLCCRWALHSQIILENVLFGVTYCQDNNSGVTERISVTHPYAALIFASWFRPCLSLSGPFHPPKIWLTAENGAKASHRKRDSNSLQRTTHISSAHIMFMYICLVWCPFYNAKSRLASGDRRRSQFKTACTCNTNDTLVSASRRHMHTPVCVFDSFGCSKSFVLISFALTKAALCWHIFCWFSRLLRAHITEVIEALVELEPNHPSLFGATMRLVCDGRREANPA